MQLRPNSTHSLLEFDCLTADSATSAASPSTTWISYLPSPPFSGPGLRDSPQAADMRILGGSSLLALILAALLSAAMALAWTPATKVGRRPVLTVVEPNSGSRVHIVGVSHGSSASAGLVRESIRSVRPAAVVLELCDERFLSVSLEAQLRPRFNATLAAMFDAKMSSLREGSDARDGDSVLRSSSPIGQMVSAVRFASGQGLVGGAFVMLGLCIGGFQRATRASSGDEFVTAMREAEELGVPVLLADAPQAETVSSIRRVFAPETVDPVRVVEGCRSLAFSALGLGSLWNLPSSLPPQVARDSQWVSIPRVFLDDGRLRESLTPLLLLLLAPSLFELVSGETAHDSSVAALTPSSPLRLGIEMLFEQLLSLAETFLNAGSFLLLVRLSQVIGRERDEYMARQILKQCRDFPHQDIVVVVGMLHCNGVARWVMSGSDPYSDPAQRRE